MMAKAQDISAPILTGTAGTESALSNIDRQSKAAFENALRAEGMDTAVEQFVQENPESFLSPREVAQLQDVGPEAFWPKYYGTSTPDTSGQGGAGGSTGSAGTSTVGNTFKASDGSVFNNYQDYLAYQQVLDGKYQKRKSAYDDLYTQFAQFGLGNLVEPLRALISDYTVDPSQYSFKMMYDPQYNSAYLQRFPANSERIKKGLTAINPATYLKLEDQYQEIMRNYGLPESYWKVGPTGIQEGFTNLIANDVSNTELEDRILNAQNRVINANPEVVQALKNFYPDIKNGDILAYVLDPKNALNDIKRKITASEIGGAALQAGLGTSAQRAEELRAAGVTGEAYQKASPFLTTASQRGQQLADIYGLGQYGQTQAEQEAFNLAGGTEAATKRRKLTELEKAAFSGSSGTSGGALSRDRAISNYMMGSPGAGAF